MRPAIDASGRRVARAGRPAWRALSLAAAAVVGVAGTAAAQAPPVAPRDPTFRAITTLVTTDVIARDTDGRFVSDLTRDDFTIREDGVPQTIVSFALVHAGRTVNLLGAPPDEPPEGIVLPAARRRDSGDAAGRLFLIFIDDLHFEAEYTPHVRRLVQTLATTLLHDGDLAAMVSSGPSAIEIEPTRDRTLIARAASKIRGSGLAADEIMHRPETSEGAADVRRRARIAFHAAYAMLGGLEPVRDLRKVVIYISTGYDFDPYAAGRRGSDRIQGGRFSDPLRFLNDGENPYGRLPAATADIDLLSYMRELTLSANRAGATVYAVDPRGLSGVVDAGRFVDQSEWRTVLQKTQSTLRFLAEETGGFAVVNINDFAAEFTRIDAETSAYYLLGYYPTNGDPRRRVRGLDITVSRSGVVVKARPAYSLETPDTPISAHPSARQ
jgi:VWFA-related protein